MKKEKYDLIFGIGAACPTSMLLRKNRLQKYSYPLDWVGGKADFNERINLLCQKFQGFLEKKDLQDTGDSYVDQGGKRRVVLNKKTGLIFHHDFLKANPLDKDFSRIQEKYQRRIQRLLTTIQNSQKILVVFQENATNPKHLKGNASLVKAYQQLCKTFPNKQWSVLYFANYPELSCQTLQEEQVAENILKISADYHSLKPTDASWTVNEKLLNKVYKKLRLKKSFKTLFHENLILSVAFFIPLRGMKRKFLGKFFKNYFEI